MKTRTESAWNSYFRWPQQWMPILWIIVISVSSATSRPFARVCYFTNWSCDVMEPEAHFCLHHIDPTLCSHIIYAFANIDPDTMGLAPSRIDDESTDGFVGRYERFNSMKTDHPHLKTMLSVGGFHQPRQFQLVTSSAASRSLFVKNTVNYVIKWGFDGLDVDWEYPTESDKESFTSLIKEFREKFEEIANQTGKPRLLLSLAGPASEHLVNSSFDVLEISRNVDLINIMSYDYSGTWNINTYHNSPLYSRPTTAQGDGPRFNPQLSVAWTVDMWLRHGADPRKLVVGAAGYGQAFTLAEPKHLSKVSSLNTDNKNLDLSPERLTREKTEHDLKASKTLTETNRQETTVDIVNGDGSNTEQKTDKYKNEDRSESGTQRAAVNNRKKRDLDFAPHATDTAGSKNMKSTHLFESDLGPVTKNDKVEHSDLLDEPISRIEGHRRRSHSNGRNHFRDIGTSSELERRYMEEIARRLHASDRIRPMGSGKRTHSMKDHGGNERSRTFLDKENINDNTPILSDILNENRGTLSTNSGSSREDDKSRLSDLQTKDDERRRNTLERTRSHSQSTDTEERLKNVNPSETGRVFSRTGHRRNGYYRRRNRFRRIQPTQSVENRAPINSENEQSTALHDDGQNHRRQPVQVKTPSTTKNLEAELQIGKTADVVRSTFTSKSKDEHVGESQRSLEKRPLFRHRSNQEKDNSLPEGDILDPMGKVQSSFFPTPSSTLTDTTHKRVTAAQTITTTTASTITESTRKPKDDAVVRTDSGAAVAEEGDVHVAAVSGEDVVTSPAEVGSLVKSPGKPGRLRHFQGQLAYTEICEYIMMGSLQAYDEVQRVPYLQRGDQWVAFEDERSIREKVTWAYSHNLGGVMFWSLDLDDFTGTYCRKGPFPLLSTIRDTVASLQDSDIAPSSETSRSALANSNSMSSDPGADQNFNNPGLEMEFLAPKTLEDLGSTTPTLSVVSVTDSNADLLQSVYNNHFHSQATTPNIKDMLTHVTTHLPIKVNKINSDIANPLPTKPTEDESLLNSLSVEPSTSPALNQNMENLELIKSVSTRKQFNVNNFPSLTSKDIGLTTNKTIYEDLFGDLEGAEPFQDLEQYVSNKLGNEKTETAQESSNKHMIEDLQYSYRDILNDDTEFSEMGFPETKTSSEKFKETGDDDDDDDDDDDEKIREFFQPDRQGLMNLGLGDKQLEIKATQNGHQETEPRSRPESNFDTISSKRLDVGDEKEESTMDHGLQKHENTFDMSRFHFETVNTTSRSLDLDEGRKETQGSRNEHEIIPNTFDPQSDSVVNRKETSHSSENGEFPINGRNILENHDVTSGSHSQISPSISDAKLNMGSDSIKTDKGNSSQLYSDTTNDYDYYIAFISPSANKPTTDSANENKNSSPRTDPTSAHSLSRPIKKIRSQDFKTEPKLANLAYNSAKHVGHDTWTQLSFLLSLTLILLF